MQDIVIENLCKAYERKPVLDHFSATLSAGSITGLMAPSGAGKTTLLRLLMGLETPDSGTITGLAGVRLSAVFQENRLCDNLSAVSNIRLVNPLLSVQEVERALERVGLSDALWQPARALSGGMRRRVQELGLVPGTRVTCVRRALSGDPIAYRIRGAVVALRKCDAAQIEVQP